MTQIDLRQSLKALGSFSVDAHYVSEYGRQVITQKDNTTPEMDQLRSEFIQALDDSLHHLTTLKSFISGQNPVEDTPQ